MSQVATLSRGGETYAVARTLAMRNLRNMLRIPGMVIPIVVMPVFFVVAFSGSFSGLVRVPGFPTDNILNWMVPFAMIQGGAFAGIGSSFGTARDLENGFADRLFLAPVPLVSMLLGAVLSSMIRALLPFFTVLPIGLLAGARLEDPRGLITLLLAVEGVAIIGALWGGGVAYRLKTQRAGALSQTGVFLALFLSTGQVPLEVSTGWLHEIARLNPTTHILAMAREGFLDDFSWSVIGPGLLSVAVPAVLFGVWAYRGLCRVVP